MVLSKKDLENVISALHREACEPCLITRKHCSEYQTIIGNPNCLECIVKKVMDEFRIEVDKSESATF